MKRTFLLLTLAATVSINAQAPPQTPPQLPKGQMPDLGRNTKHDDAIPLFDFDAYFPGRWTFEWDVPESPLGPAGRIEGTTIYRKTGEGTYQATTEAEDPADKKFTINEVIKYQREHKTITRDVVDSRGFKYSQKGTVGGDLGGIYTIYFEGVPFTANGKSVQLRQMMRLTAPLAYRLSTTIAVDGGEFRNYGTPWWRKVETRN